MAEINSSSFVSTTIPTTATTPDSKNVFTIRPKLHGRAFYEAIGSPKYIVAPMVDRSEFAWRVLTRSYLTPAESSSLLAYTPMLHARLFSETTRFRNDHFQPLRSPLETCEPPSESSPESQPFLDGNPSIDRPLFVQFCSNKPSEFLAAAKYVAPYCDAVDLNLGCPQGIAKSGRYGAFLQEDWDTIFKLINTLHKELPVPVTAKIRILETKEKTLEYARTVLSAGASILTVHGRRREQKSHNTGIADWQMIRFLRDNLPKETVLFANGNILNSGDLAECLKATGADGVMSAEGNLSDPTIFAQPPPFDSEVGKREYWRDPVKKDIGGYRLDGVLRRYMEIIYKYVLEKEAPVRQPLWIPGDPESKDDDSPEEQQAQAGDDGQPPRKKQKRDMVAIASPNLRPMQGHLFGLLRPLVSVHIDIRDLLARTRVGDIESFEKVLSMVEKVTKRALKEEADALSATQESSSSLKEETKPETTEENLTFSQRTAAKYRRPWWVAQPYIRPLPEEALANGALALSKKDKAKAAMEKELNSAPELSRKSDEVQVPQTQPSKDESTAQLPASALICG